jgi:CBS domain-containing protein
MKRGRGDKGDGATSLAELLEHTAVADLKKAGTTKPLVTLAASDTVEKALSMLAEHDILSAPVVERVGRSRKLRASVLFLTIR